MRVYLAEEGESKDVVLPQGSTVEVLMESLASVTGIDSRDQILLYNDQQLRPDDILDGFVSDPKKKIFMFNKRNFVVSDPGTFHSVEEDETIAMTEMPTFDKDPSVEVNGKRLCRRELLDMIREAPNAVDMLPLYKALFQIDCVQAESMQTFVTECQNIFVARKSRMQIRVEANIAALENMLSFCSRRHSELKKMCENAHRRLEDTVPLMTDIYAKHEELSNVKLHSALCSEKYSSLADHVPQAELFQFVEKFKKNHVSLTKKLTEIESSNQLTFEEAQAASQERGDEELERLKDASNTIQSRAENLSLQKQSFHRDYRRCVDIVQAALSTDVEDPAAMKNSRSAFLGNPEEAVGTLEKMYQGHLEFLEQEIGTLEEISRIVQLVGESASASRGELLTRLFRVSKLQTKMRDLRPKGSLFSEALRQYLKDFKVLQTIPKLPVAYNAMLYEILRRRSFDGTYHSAFESSKMKLEKLRAAEIARRTKFNNEFGPFIPLTLFPGLTDAPPPLEWRMKEFDSLLPQVDVVTDEIHLANMSESDSETVFALAREVDKMKSSDHDVVEEAIGYRDEVKRLTAENDLLKRQIREFKEPHSSATGSSATTLLPVSRLLSELCPEASMSKDVGGTADHVLEESMNVLRQRFATITKELDILKATKVRVMDEKNFLAEEKEKLEDRHTQLQSEIEQLRERTADLEASKVHLMNEKNFLAEEKEKLEDRNTLLQRENDQLRERIADLREELTSSICASDIASELEKKTAYAEERLEVLSAQVKSLTERNSSLSKELLERRGELEAAVRQREVAVEEQRKLGEEMNLKLATEELQQKQVDELVAEKQRLQDSMAQQAAELEKKTLDIARLSTISGSQKTILAEFKMCLERIASVVGLSFPNRNPGEKELPWYQRCSQEVITSVDSLIQEVENLRKSQLTLSSTPSEGSADLSLGPGSSSSSTPNPSMELTGDEIRGLLTGVANSFNKLLPLEENGNPISLRKIFRRLTRETGRLQKKYEEALGNAEYTAEYARKALECIHQVANLLEIDCPQSMESARELTELGDNIHSQISELANRVVQAEDQVQVLQMEHQMGSEVPRYESHGLFCAARIFGEGNVVNTDDSTMFKLVPDLQGVYQAVHLDDCPMFLQTEKIEASQGEVPGIFSADRTVFVGRVVLAKEKEAVPDNPYGLAEGCKYLEVKFVAAPDMK